MSRLHVHVHVCDLEQSLRFYTSLFGQAPSRVKSGYAKWMLEDPRLNFAISTGSERRGIGHLGIQVEGEAELDTISARGREAADNMLVQHGARCCYAKGDKAWIEDPEGVQWELFRTTGKLDGAGDGSDESYLLSGADRDLVSQPGCGCILAAQEHLLQTKCANKIEITLKPSA